MDVLPSPDDLSCFVEVARLSSFKGAARSLALTPGAVSLRIKNLEAMLGVSLLARTTRRVSLTERGQAFLVEARAALEAIEQSVRAARGETAPPPVELQLGTRHELGMSWIVPMLPSLGRAIPFLTLHLYFGSGPDLLKRVRAGELDCAVTSTRLTDARIDSRVLHDERYVFVGAPGLLDRVPLARPADTAAHTLVDATEALPLFRYLRDAPGGAGDLRFASTRRMGTISAIRALVLAGQGVAVLPEYYVQPDLRQRRLRRLLPSVPVLSDQFRLVFHAGDSHEALFDQLAEHMRARALR